MALVEALQRKPAEGVAWLGPIPAAESREIYLSMLSATVKEDASALVGVVVGLLDKQRTRAERAEAELQALRVEANSLSNQAATEIASLRDQLGQTRAELAEQHHLAELDAADYDALRKELESIRELVKEKVTEASTATAAVLASGTLIGALQGQHARDVAALTTATSRIAALEAELAYYRGDAEEDNEEETVPIGSEECGYLSDHGYGGADV